MVLPAAGGVMLAVYDTSFIFVVAGLGYLVMFVVVWTIRLKLPGRRETSALQQTWQGVEFILTQPMFRNLILLSFATMFFVSSYMQVMPAFAALFNAGPQGFGVLMSATGVGSIVGTLVASHLGTNGRYGLSMLGGAVFAVIALLGFAASALGAFYLLGLGLVMLSALGTSIFLILSTTAMQVQVPDDLRGRVMGIHGITYSLMSLGGLFTGGVALQLGTPYAVMLSLFLYMIIIGIIGFGSSAVRDYAGPDS